MAKYTNAMTFKNAEIVVDDDCKVFIEEVTKDSFSRYSLDGVINNWKGIAGISIVIKCDKDAEPDTEGAIDD